MSSTFRKSKAKRCHGTFTHGKNKYSLFFGPFEDLLRDKRISWEAKGYISGVMFTPDDIEFSPSVASELLEFGYLVEVEQ